MLTGEGELGVRDLRRLPAGWAVTADAAVGDPRRVAGGSNVAGLATYGIPGEPAAGMATGANGSLVLAEGRQATVIKLGRGPAGHLVALDARRAGGVHVLRWPVVADLALHSVGGQHAALVATTADKAILMCCQVAERLVIVLGRAPRFRGMAAEAVTADARQVVRGGMVTRFAGDATSLAVARLATHALVRAQRANGRMVKGRRV